MDSESELPQIHVQPGESHLVRTPAILCTLLGSCVGVTFWVKRLGVGALCHPMMPSFPARLSAPVEGASALRYVDFTIRDLAAQLDATGARRPETEVKLFGGADVLQVAQNSSRSSVGKLNCEAALRVLRAEGYAIAASSLGGEVGMQIYFNTTSGKVLLRRFGRCQTGRRGVPRENQGDSDA